MDCYTKQRCPGCQPVPQGAKCRQDVPMGPGPVIRPDLPLGSGPAVRRDQPARPEMPMNQGFMNSPCNMDQFPVAMAYVPWQRWQQVYPVDKAINRGTIFPDLDKPFSMGRCR